MPQFLVRIWFEDLNAEEQASLEQQVAALGLEPFVRSPLGQRFALPPGTYRYEGQTTTDDLRIAIADAIERFRNWQTVVVAQIVDMESHGLMPLDPPPGS